jgi:isopenicillin N synthase-like dioxygenase
MKPAVLTYIDEMTRLGAVLMDAVSQSLGLRADAFGQQFVDPTTLFRMFHYPPHDPARFSEKSVGVGEHTDYGYITILKQDDTGGLQAKTPRGDK